MTGLRKLWNVARARALAADGELEPMLCLVETGAIDAQSEFTKACKSGNVDLARGLVERFPDRVDLSDDDALLGHVSCKHADMLRFVLDLSKRRIEGPIPATSLRSRFYVACFCGNLDAACVLFEWCDGWIADPRFDIHKDGDMPFRQAVFKCHPFAVRLLTWCESRLGSGGRHVVLHALGDVVFRGLISRNNIPRARWYAALCNGARFGGPSPIAPDILSFVFERACNDQSFKAAEWLATSFGLSVPGVFTSRAASSVLTALRLRFAVCKFRLAFCAAPERRRTARVGFFAH